METQLNFYEKNKQHINKKNKSLKYIYLNKTVKSINVQFIYLILFTLLSIISTITDKNY